MAEQYSNRSDLRNPAQKIAKQAAKGQPYGEAAKQMRAQEAVPMGQAPTEAAPVRSRPRPQPGQVADLMAPTERPSESLVGYGSRPAAPPTILPMRDPVVDELEVLFQMFPNDDLRDLISALRYGGQ